MKELRAGRSAGTGEPARIPLKPGRYRHYKGKEYTVCGIARHSETAEELVVYRPEYGEWQLWVRSLAMFLEMVDVDGRQVPRFEFVGPENEQPPGRSAV